MHDLGSDWWEERKGEGEEEEAGGGGGVFGRDNKKYCTYNTFVHPSYSFILLLPLSSPTFSFLYLIAYPINIPFPRCS